MKFLSTCVVFLALPIVVTCSSCTDPGEVIGYNHNVTAVNNAYSGGVYAPTLDRIYFVPYGQADEDIWHYIDGTTGEVVNYTHPDTAPHNNAYEGGVYAPTLDRIYFVPSSESNKATWHYVNGTNGEIIGYTHGLGSLNSGAYSGGVYAPTLDRIYFVPYWQSNQNTWHYVDGTNGAVVGYPSPSPKPDIFAYIGGVYAPTLDRIYFVPYDQADEDTWHYINGTNGAVVGYNHPDTTAENDAYSGGVYAPTLDRIYFVPYNQAGQDIWHYIDGETGVVTNYTHTTAVTTGGAYNGGVYAPTRDHIFFVPNLQSSATKWHRVNGTGDARGYTHSTTITYGDTYNGGVYAPTLERVYFVPYGQADEDIWHYIDVYNCSSTTVSTTTVSTPTVSTPTVSTTSSTLSTPTVSTPTVSTVSSNAEGSTPSSDCTLIQTPALLDISHVHESVHVISAESDTFFSWHSDGTGFYTMHDSIDNVTDIATSKDGEYLYAHSFESTSIVRYLIHPGGYLHTPVSIPLTVNETYFVHGVEHFNLVNVTNFLSMDTTSDGKLVVASNDNIGISLWNISDTGLPVYIDSEGININAVAMTLSQSDNFIYTTRESGKIDVWSRSGDTITSITTIDVVDQRITLDFDMIDVVVSPDGTYMYAVIISSSMQYKVVIWDRLSSGVHVVNEADTTVKETITYVYDKPFVVVPNTGSKAYIYIARENTGFAEDSHYYESYVPENTTNVAIEPDAGRVYFIVENRLYYRASDSTNMAGTEFEGLCVTTTTTTTTTTRTTTPVSTTTPTTTPTTKGRHDLSEPELAGIVTGVVLGMPVCAALVGLLVLAVRVRRNRGQYNTIEDEFELTATEAHSFEDVNFL